MSDRPRFRSVHIVEHGTIEGVEESGLINEGVRFRASLPLLLIREAWDRGCDMEDLADGFEGFAIRIDPVAGTSEAVAGGKGTRGDWSGIRDSTAEAKDRMLERALNFFFAAPST